MSKSSEQQPAQPSDPCDETAPLYFAMRAKYNEGNFTVTLIDEVVSGGSAYTSRVTAYPQSGTTPYSSASALAITPVNGTPSGTATKTYVSGGNILVTFTHPPDCQTYEWDLEFTANPPLVPLKVKIRKTRVPPLVPTVAS